MSLSTKPEVMPPFEQSRRLPGGGAKQSIEVSMLNGASWTPVGVIEPRFRLSWSLLDLAPHLGSSTSVPVTLRFNFTATHRIDYIGVDKSSGQKFAVASAELLFAQNATAGNVTDLLRMIDGSIVELFPGEAVELLYLVPELAKNGWK